MTKPRSFWFLGFLPLSLSSCTTSGDVLEDVQRAPLLDEPAEGSPDRSGTRLRVVYERHVGEDGARVSVPTNRFYDTKLDVDCKFAIAEDGVRRCLPIVTDLEFQNPPTVGGLFFLNGSCTERVVRHPAIFPVKYALQHNKFSTAWQGFGIRKLSPLTLPVTVYYGNGTVCNPLDAAQFAEFADSQTLYKITETVAPTEFVKGQLLRAVSR